jgi:hypothetical protein
VTASKLVSSLQGDNVGLLVGVGVQLAVALAAVAVAIHEPVGVGVAVLVEVRVEVGSAVQDPTGVWVGHQHFKFPEAIVAG